MSVSSLIRKIKNRDHETRSSSHLVPRLLALIVSIFVALAAGTPYLYGVYAPQLMKRVGFTTSDSATISLASNLGSSVGGLPGGLLIDHFGPQVSIFTGSMCIFIGFFSMYKIYQHQFHSLVVICVAIIFVGFGSITCFFATLKASQANFAKHKGVAGAFPVSCYGFGATVFSIISATFFNDNAGALLQFLAFFCGSVTFFGSFFVHIYSSDDADDDADGDGDEEEALSPISEYSRDSPSQSTTVLPDDELSLLAAIETPAQSITKADSLKGSISFWGIGERTPRSSISLQESEATNAVRNLGNSEDVVTRTTTTTSIKIKAKLQSPYETIKERLTDRIFLIHYLIIAIASGIGQMYIYSIGFIVTAQYYYNKHDGVPPTQNNNNHILMRAMAALAHDPEAASLQAVQVSIISIASFSGRLLSGFLSDYIHKRWHIQRLWIVLFTLVILATAQYLTIINVSSFHLTSVVSAMVGGSYGLIFGTYPAVMADSFGTRTFSTTWGLVCTGPLFVLYVLNKLFGWIYDSNTDKESGVCYLGNLCYMGAFDVSLCLCGLCFVVTSLLIYMQRT
ncbi:uncharacterized protein LODBEIA_P51830 [Lodderomyces beijingensis]|uniref:Nodulin-like domain-containing protein n=1 Tax=Lodderomyces beijingensis TaxID=1775926 RepID=A0ABP0ZS79_9ASCO